MLEKERRPPGEVGLTIANKGNGTAAEVQSVSLIVANDFHAVWTAPLFLGVEGASQRRHAGGRVVCQHADEQIECGGVDERFVALEVDDDVIVEPARNLGDAIGSAGMIATSEHHPSAKAVHGRD